MINITVIKRISIESAIFLAFWIGSSLAADEVPGPPPNALSIGAVIVQGKTLRPNADKELSLGTSPDNIVFTFGPVPPDRTPMRLLYKLDGYETVWHEGKCEMYFGIRFLDDAGDQVGHLKEFKVEGDSTGWKGTLENSTLTHRRETVAVPPRATQLQAIISSAGPPSTVGIYVVDDLVVSTLGGSRASEVLARAPFDGRSDDNQDPPGWVRDGIHPRMAQIIELGQEPKTKAFAILDDDPFGHAEWHQIKGSLPRVTAGDNLILEWNELYSMGVGDIRAAHYGKLPAGKYKFRVEETGSIGGPARAEASLAVLVPVPFWQMPWFWATLAALAVAASTASIRYLAWHRMRRTMLRLQQQGALEQERLRIAQDIHDDLGARVTQISLVSAMAEGNVAFPEKARAEFDRISCMSRDLVSALYETVWAVNPENDNLDAMGTYLCQKINQLCTQAHLGCRLHVVDLPQHVRISSQMRHNISMAAKEAVHNVIKHARASLVTMRVTFSDMLLTVSIQDDGCGFDVADTPPGNGVVNMKRRLKAIGGSCLVESWPGQGTTVQMRLIVKSLQEDGHEDPAPCPPAPPESQPKDAHSSYEKISSGR